MYRPGGGRGRQRAQLELDRRRRRRHVLRHRACGRGGGDVATAEGGEYRRQIRRRPGSKPSAASCTAPKRASLTYQRRPTSLSMRTNTRGYYTCRRFWKPIYRLSPMTISNRAPRAKYSNLPLCSRRCTPVMFRRRSGAGQSPTINHTENSHGSSWRSAYFG